MRAEKRRAGRAIRKTRREARQEAERLLTSGELPVILNAMAEAIVAALAGIAADLRTAFAAVPRQSDYALTPVHLITSAPGSPAAQTLALPTPKEDAIERALAADLILTREAGEYPLSDEALERAEPETVAEFVSALRKEAARRHLDLAFDRDDMRACTVIRWRPGVVSGERP